MRTAHAASQPVGDRTGTRVPRLHNPRASLAALLRGPRLDRELAAGVGSWHSPAHATRAVKLTSDRSRRGLAAGLERLVADAQAPARSPRLSSSIPPCREQVHEGLPQIFEVISLLRGHRPLDGRGVAALRVLLQDGSGPCYSRIDRAALRNALLRISRSMEALD